MHKATYEKVFSLQHSTTDHLPYRVANQVLAVMTRLSGDIDAPEPILQSFADQFRGPFFLPCNVNCGLAAGCDAYTYQAQPYKKDGILA